MEKVHSRPGVPDTLLPGIKINTSATDFYPIQSVQLARFDGYWGTKAAYKSFDFKLIPDSNTRISALKAGQVDAVIPEDVLSHLVLAWGPLPAALCVLGGIVFAPYAISRARQEHIAAELKVRRAEDVSAGRSS